MTGRGRAQTVATMPVSVEFFSLLGVRPMLGRTFTPADLAGGCNIVLSHKFWQSTLGGDRGSAGQSLRLDGQACTILGVMPPDFAFYPDAAQLWVLMTPPPRPDVFGVGIFARLKPAVSMERAQAELISLRRQLHRENRAPGARLHRAVKHSDSGPVRFDAGVECLSRRVTRSAQLRPPDVLAKC